MWLEMCKYIDIHNIILWVWVRRLLSMRDYYLKKKNGVEERCDTLLYDTQKTPHFWNYFNGIEFYLDICTGI